MPRYQRLSQARYALLLKQLLAEDGGDPSPLSRSGARTRVAGKVGISAGLLTKILDGEKEAGGNSIDLAIERLDLDPYFFYDPDIAEPNYAGFTQWLSRRRLQARRAPAERREPDLPTPIIAWRSSAGYAELAPRAGFDRVSERVEDMAAKGGLTPEQMTVIARDLLGIQAGKIVDRAGRASDRKAPEGYRKIEKKTPKRR